MKPLTDKLRLILLEGPKDSGTYLYPDAILRFEGSMTLAEHKAVMGFLGWIVKNKLTYGHGNLRELWGKYQK